ncbi:ArsB/NhaD family transporter [Streptomyces sp. SID13666]|uniref:SLC13 family permease n=1 Tax=unclassified Streptomyces TaxID=2593676 RepID=UPI0013C0E010|nr:MULTISPECIES: ArsB/NhaD family transporter [unclassified Streptomyces]NEA59655.1 ArsB/NhaD family transporter [Streptomyces sp. SID13666]NEA75822.1 ArsB/NhaD family transporter [Streptomyces sp. SID13588]
MSNWHAWAALTVFAGAYVLIITEWVHRVAAALGGAAVMMALRATDADAAFFSTTSGIDWNVIFLLLGMMMIVAVLRRTGLFEFLAIWAVKRARARPFRVLVMLIVITAGASALLDNVTTVLLVAPVTLVVCERLALPVAPFLIAEVLASNIGGIATLVGDPPNIIIGTRADLTFNDFATHLGPLAVILTGVLVLMSRIMFRSAFVHDEERATAVLAMNERDAIRDRRLLLQGLVVLAAVVAGFILHPVLHYEPSVVALLGAGLLIALTPVSTEEVLREVEWPTLAFFAGLFVMVGALIQTGVITTVSTALADATGGNALGAAMLLLGGSAVLSGVVDNIPYVATMAPITASLATTIGPGHGQVLWWALAAGADLGGNATAIGASANVVVLGIAERNKTPISFWTFTRYGAPVAAVTITVSAAYIWVRYFALT